MKHKTLQIVKITYVLFVGQYILCYTFNSTCVVPFIYLTRNMYNTTINIFETMAGHR